MTVKPALTAEEWAEAEAGGFFFEPSTLHKVTTAGPSTILNECQTAALCLHNQPFGFTREDVHVLRCLAANSDGMADWGYHAEEVADRIEALLPPEDLE